MFPSDIQVIKYCLSDGVQVKSVARDSIATEKMLRRTISEIEDHLHLKMDLCNCLVMASPLFLDKHVFIE